MNKHQEIRTLFNQEFTIDLPPNLLLQIMENYQLKADDVTGDYVFDLALYETLIQRPPLNGGESHQSPLKNSLGELHHWPKQLTWQQFNHHIISLLTNWLKDYKLENYYSSTKIDNAFILARCLKLQAPQAKNQPDLLADCKFQSLLMHLLARATNQFDQHQHHYSLNFDLVTGLPNQQLMFNILGHIEEEGENPIGLLLLNLNININKESPLNTVAPNLILAAIDLIQQHLNDDAMLFYIGNNELAILIDHLHFSAQLNLIASKLIHAFEFALPLENNTLILKPYFGGVSSFDKTPNTPSIYDCAKLALHHAILNNYQIEIYDPHITTSFASLHQLEEAIIEALQQNELEVFLQPIITISSLDFDTETCVSAELLLRWNHKDWPSISPMRLVDTIYKKGFGRIFIRWLINSACQRAAELSSLYKEHFSLTLNLCSPDLLDDDLPELLAQAIALWEIPAETLVIEITESDLLLDEAKAMLVIEKIASLGCQFALDDFGTGYSSMTRLRNMPIDLVKIDQSFVRHIETSKQDREIVQSIIQLAHSLEKKVVAEGVENLTCLNMLKQMQCEKIQGHYFSEPMHFDEFTTWLTAFKAR